MTIDNKELLITPASFKDANYLKKMLCIALKQGGFNFDLSNLNNIENNIEQLLPGLLNIVLSVATSDEVEAALFKCAEKALFDKQKIDIDFFENIDNRQYYYPIMIELIKVNIAPFFKSLNSLLQNLGGLIQGFTQKQK